MTVIKTRIPIWGASNLCKYFVELSIEFQCNIRISVGVLPGLTLADQIWVGNCQIG